MHKNRSELLCRKSKTSLWVLASALRSRIVNVLIVKGEIRAFVNQRGRKWLLVGASTVAPQAHERTKLRSPSSPRGGPRRGAGPERGSSIPRQQGGSGLAGGRYAQREPGGGGSSKTRRANASGAAAATRTHAHVPAAAREGKEKGQGVSTNVGRGSVRSAAAGARGLPGTRRPLP